MNTRTDLNLTLYENLLKIDEKIKEYFQVSISPIISASFKRGILENFEQKLKRAELESDKFTNYIDIIKDNYLSSMEHYFTSFKDKLEYIKGEKISNKEQKVIDNFDFELKNIINNNISHIEKKIKTIDDNYELNNDIER